MKTKQSGSTAGLEKHCAMRRRDTVAAVKDAIAALQRDERAISLASIREAAMALPVKRRLSESTIIRNSDAYALYRAAAPKRPVAKVARTQWLLGTIPRDELSADKRASSVAAISALRRLSRAELVLLAWRREQEIQSLKLQLKAIRAARLDKVLPTNVRSLRPVSGAR